MPKTGGFSQGKREKFPFAFRLRPKSMLAVSKHAKNAPKVWFVCAAGRPQRRVSPLNVNCFAKIVYIQGVNVNCFAKIVYIQGVNVNCFAKIVYIQG